MINRTVWKAQAKDRKKGGESMERKSSGLLGQRMSEESERKKKINVQPFHTPLASNY